MDQLDVKVKKEIFKAKFNVIFNAIFLAVLFILLPASLKMGWLYITLWCVTFTVMIYILINRVEVYKKLKA